MDAVPPAVRFWAVPFVAVLLFKSAVQSQDPETCVNITDTAVLSCGITLTGGVTLRALQWRKVGLTPNDLIADYFVGTVTPGPAYIGRQVTVNDTGFLLLDNVQQDDFGTYRCTAGILTDSNAVPELENKLEQAGEPGPVSCPGNTVVNERNNVNLICSAGSPGCPSAQLAWYNTSTGDQVNSGNGILTFTNVTRWDKGIYECVASNTHGDMNCQVTLNVSYAPECKGDVQHVSGNIFSGARLRVSVDASPAAEIIWRKHTENSSEVLQRSMEMSFDVSYEDMGSGNYSATAANSLGSTLCAEFVVTFTEWELALVTVIVILLAVVIILLVAVVIIHCNSALVEITASSNLTVEIRWIAKCKGSYKVLYRLKGSKADWAVEPEDGEVSTNDYPNYKYTVEVPQDGTYEVCVQGTITCCRLKVKSKIQYVTVPDNSPYGGPGDDHGSSVEQNTPLSPLHGNNAPKTDVPLVVMITEGQSHKVKLDPIVINKQNPAEKKEKKKKRKKKVNKVNVSESDEDKKPED